MEFTNKDAQDAFKRGDTEYSSLLHAMSTAPERHTREAGEYLKSVVFGGLDGIITTFAVVAAAVAVGLSSGLVLVIGFSNLIGDAIGMGIGDFLSSAAQKDHVRSEKEREQWEMDHCLEREKEEMWEIYEKRGMSPEDAREVVELLLENRELFLNVMMAQELGLLPEEGTRMDEFKGALITFASFLICGGIPMLPYLIAGNYAERVHLGTPTFWISIILFAVTLFILGVYKGIVINGSWWKSGFIILLNGSITTILAYYVGYFLETLGDSL